MSNCYPPIRGIPYDFNGTLSLENLYRILASDFCGMKDAIDHQMNAWFAEWVKNNLEGVFGDIMYSQDTETITFSIENIIQNAQHSISNETLNIMEVK